MGKKAAPLRIHKTGQKRAVELALLGANSDQRRAVKLPRRLQAANGNEPAWGAMNGSLTHVELFSSLTKKELDEIRSTIVLKEFKKNEIILFEEETSEYMYVIVKGKVKISRAEREGKEMILSIHRAGEFFGEMSLIDGKTVPATVSAIERSLVALISRKHFFLLLYAQNKILDNLLRILCARLREAWKRIQILNFNDASLRIKMLFLMLSESYGEKTPDGTTTLRIKLIHQDIAAMTGLTRETVTRVLDKWKRKGEISYSRNKLVQLHSEFESIAI